MAHDLGKLQGQVPESVMMGQTEDISFICKFPGIRWFCKTKQDANSLKI
jgi:hypothetical protein